MNEIIKQLSEKLSNDAVQRTKGVDTKKGYDTTGYGYQSIVDRFNEILDIDWGYDWEVIHAEKGKYRDKADGTLGSPYWEIVVKVSIWIKDKNPRSCVGGHTGKDYADALKGAITNGFKKTAAFWGVGRDAFAGTIDDDNQPLPGKADDKIPINNTNKNGYNTFEENYNNLSDEVKKGFKLANWTDGKIKVRCLKYNFDEDKLNEEINKDLK